MADSIQLGIRITADGKGAEGTINSLNRTIEKVGDSSRKASASLGGIEKATQGLSSAASTAGRALAGLGVAFSARQLIQTADAYSGIVAKLKLVSGSTQEFAAAQSQLFEISQRNMTPLAETVQLYSRLATSMRDLGRSQKDTLAITDLVGKTIRISGADASSAAAGILQFSQAIGSGVLRGDEFNSMMENSPRLAKALADGLNVPIGSLREMAAQGELTADKVVNAILSQSEAIKREYTTMPVTVSGAFQQIQNALTAYVGQTDQANGASKELAEALSLIANNLNEILDPLSTVINTLVKIEVGGWLTLVDAIKAAKVELKEMVGLKDGGGAIDPEVVKLMRYGLGQASIGEIAGPPPQAAAAQKEFFDGVKRGANDAALAMTKLSEKQKAVAQIVIETAKAYKVDPAFALAIAQQESGFNQLAKSAVGARGVMQLMPGTAKQLGVNFNDLNDNIKGGVMYLAQQEKQFKSLRLAAAAYNAGPGNVQKFGGVPPFKETQNYVVSVGALYEKWQKVLGAQGESFTSAKDQADELSTAFNRLKTHQDDQVKRAEEYAKVQVEQIKTRLAAMDQERQAAADVAAQELAGAKTYQQKSDIIEAAQQKAAAYNAEALDMVRAEFDAQEAVIKARQAALANELAQADQYNVTIDEQFKLKQALRAADNDLAILAQNRAQAEIAASGKANEFAQKAITLKQGEASAIDGIIGAYQRQLDILTRLTAAKEAGASADQLSLLNDFYQSADALPELVSPDQIARMEQYTLSTKALKGAVDELTGAQKKNEEQAVKESQLRQNAFWDQLIGRAQEYANIWNQIGENGSDAFSVMMVASNKFIKNVDQIGKAYDAVRESGGGSFALDLAEGMAQAQNGLNMVAQSLILVRDQYAKGSAEYQKYEQMAAGVAVAAKIAAVAEGILAVVHQMSSGDPYTAIPRALAVAGMLASLGIQTGASGGKGTSATTQRRQETQGTGTVFGDTAAQSNSIANSLEIIRENTSNDLNYSAAMLRAMEDLSLNILALANQVTMSVMPAIDEALKNSGMKFGMSRISLFSGFNKQLTDSGIGWFETALGDILKGGFSAKLYADVTKSFEVFGMALSSSTKTYVGEAGQEVSNQIIRIFKDIVTAFQEGAKAFGVAGNDVLAALEGYTIGQTQISLKDMTLEEQTKALNAVFSSITDSIAETLDRNLGLQLDRFRQSGEGMAQTFLRVSAGISRAQGELERLGVEAIRYTKITNAQGNVAAEIIRQSLAAQTTLSSGVREYINVLQGGAEEIVEAYKTIMRASSLLKTAGIGDSGFSIVMTNAAGGLSAFVEAMESFTDNFLSPAEQYAGAVRDVGESFARLGVSLPTSKDGFRDLVAGIDTSTDAGKKLFGALIALAPAFAEIATQAESIREKYAAVLDPFKAMGDQIKEVGSDFKTLLTGVTAGSISRLEVITTGANNARDPLFAERNALMKRIKARFGGVAQMNEQVAYWERKLADELAKAPKKQNKEVIKTLKTKIARWSSLNSELNALNEELAQIMAKEGMDKAAEIARVALEKQAIIDDAVTSMGATLEDVFSQIVQTVQASQQRLQSVVAVQKSLASQLAQLQGPGAVFDLANADRNSAFGAIDNYILGVQGGAGRNVETEVGLLNDAQAAVMARYNAEIAAIQEAEREYIAAETDRLNASLQAQIDAINAATEAAIDAESDRLEAAIKAQGKLDQAEQKALNQRFDAEQKRLNKQFDAEQKALNKQFDQEQKALQKAHDVQMKALTDELDAANKLRDAIRNIQDYVRGMALGGNSPLSPEQRLAEAQRQYQDLLLKAQGGDAEAMGKLTGASDAYLEATKAYYGSGTQYANTFDAVKNAMSAIGGMSAPDPDSIQSRIDELRESQASQLEALRDLQSDQMDLLREQQSEQMDVLRDIQAEQMDLLREQQQDRLDALRTASQAVQDEIRKTAQAQIEAAQKATQQSIADLSDPNKNLAMRAAREAAERDLKELQRLAELTRIEAQKQADEAKAQAEQMARDALDLANKQLAELQAGTRVSRDTVAALNAILRNAKLEPIPGYANGGMAGPGLAMVGERGPELVRFNRPGQVINANDTKSMLGDDEKIVAAIARLELQMQAVVVTQSNANPQIIDKLSGMEARLSKMERTQRFTVGA
jgi:tape measure domain-containing protein